MLYIETRVLYYLCVLSTTTNWVGGRETTINFLSELQTRD